MAEDPHAIALLAAMLEGAPRRLRGRRHRRRRGRRPTYPHALERRYVRALEGISRGVSSVIALEFRRALGIRADSLDVADIARLGKIGSVWDTIRARVLRKLNDTGFIEIVDVIAAALETENREVLGEVLNMDLSAESPMVQAELEAWRTSNVALIRSIAEEQLLDVLEVTTEAIEAGTRVEELAKMIEERFGVSQSRARLIARDQVAKANSAITQARHREAGITSYRWSSSQDERVRRRHQELEGTEHRWDQPPIVDAKRGRREHPGGDFQCRCVAIPVFDD